MFEAGNSIYEINIRGKCVKLSRCTQNIPSNVQIFGISTSFKLIYFCVFSGSDVM